MVVGGTEAMLVRAQLIVPNNHFLSADFYNQMFTMHGLTMIFLVVMPLETGFFGNFLIPLHIGARDVAFPRLNALSYWIFLFGAISLNLGWILGGLPEWRMVRLRQPDRALLRARPEHRLLRRRPAHPRRFIRYERPEFLRHDRQYARARHDVSCACRCLSGRLLVTVILVLLAFPAITVGLIFLFADRYFDAHFYRSHRRRHPDAVAASVLDLRSSRSLHHGAARLRHDLRSAAGVLAQTSVRLSDDGLLDHPDRVPLLWRVGPSHVRDRDGSGGRSAFAITSMLIAIPTGVKIFSWIATVWGGRLRFTTAMLFALGLHP